jgi:hypothetical protein
MKKLLFIAVMLGIVLTGCKKKDDNYFSWGAVKITNIAYAGFHKSTSGYALGLVQNTPTEVGPWDSPNRLILQIPNELMDEKIDLDSAEYKLKWYPYGEIEIGGEFNWWRDKNQDNSDNKSGTGNWMKVTKNAENKFTIEVSVTVGGKMLKCHYKGTFIHDDDM